MARGLSKAKESFLISEVADITGIKPHVLRYWEGEFPQLKPAKSPSGLRLYKAKDIDIVRRLKRLLHEEEYSIAGARRKLEEELRGTRLGQLPLELDLQRAEMVGAIAKAKRQVATLRGELESPLPDPGSPPAPEGDAP